MTRAALLLLAACAATLALVAPAIAGDCDRSVLLCDPYRDGSPIVFPIETEQLTAVVGLRTDNGTTALETYRSLVRAPYAMPERPAVALWFADATIPHAFGPWRPAAFAEASIAIKVRHGAEEGWFHLSMPTDGQGNHDLGRDVGFPKYLAETAFTRSGTGRSATAARAGRQTMALDWSPGAAATGDELRRWTLFRSPFFSFNPVFTGPATRVKYTVKPYVPTGDLVLGHQPREMEVAPLNGLAEPVDGVLRYRLDPDLDTIDDTLPDLFGPGRSLADLVAPTGTVPGHFWHGEGYLMIQSARLE
jgi:hypothetical protein